MKKFATFVAAVAASLVLAAQAHAQFGFVVGLTSSLTQMKTAEDMKAISLYHAGVTYKVDLGLGFAVQPSLLYQVKGARIGEINESTTMGEFKVKTGFVELPVSLQWGPDLLAFRPYVFAEPFIGYAVTSSDSVAASFDDWAAQAKNKFEYGFGLGGGLEIASHVQLAVQYFHNMGSLFSEKSEERPVTEEVKNFKGIKFSLSILF